MLLGSVKMLKKRLGIEAIESVGNWREKYIFSYFKIPSTLIIPGSVKVIENATFIYCNRLKKVVISEGVKEIGRFAFENCRNLKEVSIPESVETIESYAFNSCKYATIILKKHKKDFKSIGYWAFGGCYDVKEEVRD